MVQEEKYSGKKQERTRYAICMNQKQNNVFIYTNFSQYFSFQTSNIIRCPRFTKYVDFFTRYFGEFRVLRDFLVSREFSDVHKNVRKNRSINGYWCLLLRAQSKPYYVLYYYLFSIYRYALLYDPCNNWLFYDYN